MKAEIMCLYMCVFLCKKKYGEKNTCKQLESGEKGLKYLWLEGNYHVLHTNTNTLIYIHAAPPSHMMINCVRPDICDHAHLTYFIFSKSSIFMNPPTGATSCGVCSSMACQITRCMNLFGRLINSK